MNKNFQHFSSRNRESNISSPDEFAYTASKAIYEALHGDEDPRENFSVELDTMIQNEYRQRIFDSGISYTEEEFSSAYNHARYFLMDVCGDPDLMGTYPQYEDVLEALLLVKEGKI